MADAGKIQELLEGTEAFQLLRSGTHGPRCPTDGLSRKRKE